MKYLERDRRKGPGISTNPKAICWNKNSGGSAINLAYHLGGSESTVYLFGFDMSKGPNGEGNWHKGYAELWNGKTVAMIAPFKRWLATFALIAGMLPLAMGLTEVGKFRQGMAVVIIGGLISSTILTLVVIPAVYGFMDTLRLRARKLVGRPPDRVIDKGIA